MIASDGTKLCNVTYVLASRPRGVPREEDFTTVESDVRPINEGEILLKSCFVSVDPYMRGMIRTLPIGTKMRGRVIAEVIASKNPNYKQGDLVRALISETFLTWSKYSISDGNNLFKVDPNNTLVSSHLGALGGTGLTAYFGILDAANLQEGETVVVSGAAGAVGSVAGQIAKIKECFVIGLAGTAEKVKWLKEIGFDVALNYKDYPTHAEMRSALRDACASRYADGSSPGPGKDGIDVYFDNTGGVISDAVFDLTNERARVAVCGQISTYNEDEGSVKVPALLHKLIGKGVKVQGFSVRHYPDRYQEALDQLTAWIKQGRIKSRETIVHGFENIPKAFIGLFSGENVGKMVCKL